MKKLVIGILVCLSVLVLFASLGSAASLTLQLQRTTDYFRTEFPDGGNPYGYIMLWSGDVKYDGVTIGEFNERITKTSTTGGNGGYINSIDIVLPNSDPEAIGSFLLIKTAHINTGSGSDIGTIYATSPNFIGLMHATVTITGDDMVLTW